MALPYACLLITLPPPPPPRLQIRNPFHPSIHLSSAPSPFHPSRLLLGSLHLRAPASTSPLASSLSEPKLNDEAKSSYIDLLACPVCFEPLIRRGPIGYNKETISASSFDCRNCKKVYINKDVFLDLTVMGYAENYIEVMPPSTEVFRNPLVSFIYERGWRQAFGAFGYPGPDEELKMAQKYLQPVVGGILVDVSCASGVSTRRFVKSGQYSAVFALDFSESMLRQFNDFLKQDMSIADVCGNLMLIRADVARLPFAAGTIDGVHAGAAIHCWPSPTSGVAEISRILKPGGIFVATTNVLDLIGPAKQVIRRTLGGYVSWTESELEEICKVCGLVDFSRIRRLGFIMFSARKPQ